MASLSQKGEVLVIRLVYDGPPESGKTSSLRTLAGGLSRQIESPEEAGGRTLFFDWVEYVGGSFEGLPIRCQIVSVPGQRSLTSRRRMLLAEADAIVFVADSTASGFQASEESLAELRGILQATPKPRPGIVVQANKRDRPGALPLTELRERLGLGTLAVVESVATAGTGIREAFVLAVRLALDRVREMRALGALRMGPLDAENAADLLRRLRAAESEQVRPLLHSGAREEGRGSLAADALRDILEDEARAEASSLSSSPPKAAHTESRGSMETTTEVEAVAVPRLPDSTVPSGRVWPPIEGRVLLHAASSIPLTPQLRVDGSWGAQEGDWWFHSAKDHEFQHLEAGKEELLRWAQLHAGRFARLSPRRCLVLSEANPGTWRLWQIVQPQPSLRQRLRELFHREAPKDLARMLVLLSDTILRARTLFAVEPLLPCRLEVIGEGSAQPVYVGFLPPSRWIPAEAEHEGDDLVFLRRALGPSIRRGLAETSPDVPLVLNALGRETALREERAPLIEMLTELLIGN